MEGDAPQRRTSLEEKSETLTPRIDCRRSSEQLSQSPTSPRIDELDAGNESPPNGEFMVMPFQRRRSSRGGRRTSDVSTGSSFRNNGSASASITSGRPMFSRNESKSSSSLVLLRRGGADEDFLDDRRDPMSREEMNLFLQNEAVKLSQARASGPLGNRPNDDLWSPGALPRSTTPKDIRKLVSFVPEQLLPFLREEGPLAPAHSTTFSVVMLADISGFTKLSEKYCAMGPEGVDRLSELISDFLGELISLVQSYKGDIVGFAGDALIITWPTSERLVDGVLINPSTQCIEQTLRVFKCGLELAQLSRQGLTLHLGIASGPITFCVLGEDPQDTGWCCLAVGEPILRMGDAERHAGSQEVVVAKETYDTVDTFCAGEGVEEERSVSKSALGSPDRKRGLVLLKNVTKPESMAWVQGEPETAGQLAGEAFGGMADFSQKLFCFIPNPALEVLRANGQYLNEYRKRVSVLFVMLDGFPIDIFDPATAGAVVHRTFQDILIELRRVLTSYNGLMRQFIIDDKGCVFIACFGVAGHTHRDDPARALGCGLSMSQAAESRGVRTFIGLTTGAAFCGAVGSVARREYAMVGRDVNLAARLMSLGRKEAFDRKLFSMLLLDETTYNETRVEPHYSFEALAPVRLKGSEKLVNVYRAKQDSRAIVGHRESYQIRAQHQPLVAREAQCKTVLDAILECTERLALLQRSDQASGKLGADMAASGKWASDKSSASKSSSTKSSSTKSAKRHVKARRDSYAGTAGCVCIVEGGQGIGKSCVVENARARAEDAGVVTAYTKALSNGRETPYVVLRQIFWLLLDVDVDSDETAVNFVSTKSTSSTGTSRGAQKRSDQAVKAELEQIRKERFLALLHAAAVQHVKAEALRESLHGAQIGSSTSSTTTRGSRPRSLSQTIREWGQGSGEASSDKKTYKRSPWPLGRTLSRGSEASPRAKQSEERRRVRRSSDPNVSSYASSSEEQFRFAHEATVGKAGKSNSIGLPPSESSSFHKQSVESTEFPRLVNEADPGGAAESRYAETVLFPFLKNILRISWKLDGHMGGGAPPFSAQTEDSLASSAQYMINLTLCVLLERFRGKTLAIFLDDAEAIDSLSGRALGILLRSRVAAVAIVLTQKPVDQPPDWQSELTMEFRTLRVEVLALDRADLLKLIDEVADGIDFKQSVKDFIIEQSHGNPGHAFELAKSIRESEDDALVENTAMIIERAVQARFDRLADTHRALLKTAAVIGNVFPLNCLQSMVPRCISRKGGEALSTVLNDLVSSEWLDVLDDSDEVLYTFRSEQARDICYNLNTSRNLKMLHLLAAQYFQKTYDEDLRPFFGLLSHHYKQSQQDTMALKFFAYSFRLNLNIGAIPEAYGILESIIDLNLDPAKLLEALREIQETVESHASKTTNLEFADAFVPQPNLDTIAIREHASSGSGSVSGNRAIPREASFSARFGIKSMLIKIETAMANAVDELTKQQLEAAALAKAKEGKAQAKGDASGARAGKAKSSTCAIL